MSACLSAPADFSGTSFAHSLFHAVDFADTNLRDANFTDCILDRCALSAAHTTNAHGVCIAAWRAGDEHKVIMPYTDLNALLASVCYALPMAMWVEAYDQQDSWAKWAGKWEAGVVFKTPGDIWNFYGRHYAASPSDMLLLPPTHAHHARVCDRLSRLAFAHYIALVTSPEREQEHIRYRLLLGASHSPGYEYEAAAKAWLSRMRDAKEVGMPLIDCPACRGTGYHRVRRRSPLWEQALPDTLNPRRVTRLVACGLCRTTGKMMYETIEEFGERQARDFGLLPTSETRHQEV